MIKPGDRGDVVTTVTNTLHRLGFLMKSEDFFSAEVESAVRAFQQERGLVVTGVVDESTAKLMEEARWKLGDRTLRFELPLMRGDDVAALQNRLIDMGFDCGRVDGIFGLLTESAVKEFQKSVGVKVDGHCGPGTVLSLVRLMGTVKGGAPLELRAQALREKRGPALADKVIVLDPQSLVAAELTLDLAEKIEGRLIALGVSVFLTRSGALVPTQEERISIANNYDADLVISLNIDHYKNESAHGVSTYFYGSDHHGVHSLVGEKFARLVQREISARTDLANNRTHSKTWEFLRLTIPPTVVIDLGYFTNPQDRSRLEDPTFRDVIAEALVVAIQRLYLSAESDAKTGTLRIEDLKRAGIRP
jgi:N-acetylmuramoyl-L-alanine amidase